MERMKKQLYRLDELVNHLASLSGLVCTLRHSMQSIQMDYKTQYLEAVCFISDALTETQTEMHQLSNDMFDSYRRWKAETNVLRKNQQ